MITPNNSTADALPSGTRFQKYDFEIGEVLGQGGFGITYQAQDAGLHRDVAIKEFFPHGCVRRGHEVQPGGALTAASYAAAKQKFLEEARALARFSHRNIVNVLTLFEGNNTAYMVMEYLKGKTLQQLVEARGALPEHEAVRHIAQVGEALSVVHQANLIHRDINPQNIIVCDDGRAVLIDFGLNKELEKASGYGTRKLTSTTSFGTSGYAPPEQYGRQGQVGEYTDIYALGATLYYLLTGEVPTEAVDRLQGATLAPPDLVNARVSGTVSKAVLRAMELKGDQRPQTVGEFLKLLTDSLLPIRPSVPSSQSPATRPIPQPSLPPKQLIALPNPPVRTPVPTIPPRAPTTPRPTPPKQKSPPARVVARSAPPVRMPAPAIAPVLKPKQNPIDGATMIWIPAGQFLMGSERGSNDEKPRHKVELDGYWIYETAVTVALYKKFCAVTGHKIPDVPIWGWQDKNPMVNVRWNDAQAYCKWAGGSLPTEAQWEKAARGIDGREYPWGKVFDRSRLQCGTDRTGMAGRFATGASPWGVLDMAGNVWEWCSDWYDEDYYRRAPSHNPPGPATGEKRVLRGGSWGNRNPDSFRVSYRYRNPPGGKSDRFGFRAASVR